MSARRLQLANNRPGWMDHKRTSSSFLESGCVDDDDGASDFGARNSRWFLSRQHERRQWIVFDLCRCDVCTRVNARTNEHRNPSHVHTKSDGDRQYNSTSRRIACVRCNCDVYDDEVEWNN